MKRKKNPVICATEEFLRGTLGTERTNAVMERFWPIYETICAENPGQTRAVQKHTVQNIYPAISFYRALQEENFSKEEAYQFLYDSYEKTAEKKAASMRSMLKIPGAYHLMPLMWQIVTRTMFSPAAGFRFHFYHVGCSRVKFDMLACPYCDACEKYGCRELVTVLCHTDDVNNGDLHPKLLWNRKKTMGGGDDCCDFDLIVQK